MDAQQTTRSDDSLRRPTPLVNTTSRSASFDQRTRSEDSWVEIASQPSSSSLSSAADEGAATGLQVPHGSHRQRRRRSMRQNRPSNLNITHRPVSAGGTSSQEEYEESESESDRVMTSSGEGLFPASHILHRPDMSPAVQSSASEDSVPDEGDDDEERTAINYPINNDQCFTPQPNAFSHPPSGQFRNASQPVPGSYYPPQRPAPRSTRHSLPTPRDNHMPQNILSPSYNAAAQHDEALRSSLTTLLSCAAAARGLSKPDTKRSSQTTTTAPSRSNKVEPMSLRLIPESQLPTNTATASSPPQFHEPTFHPTIRRDHSTSTSASSPSPERLKEIKRKAGNGRASSRERRSVKKARRGTSTTDENNLPIVSPTLLTWVVSAGVVVALSALSFSAGYSLGKEAGRMEAGAGSFASDAAEVRSCAREAGRSGLGLRRSLARSAVQV